MLNVRYLSTLSIMIKHFDQCINTLICDIEDKNDKDKARKSIEISPFTTIMKELEETGTSTAVIYDFDDDFSDKYDYQIGEFNRHIVSHYSYWDKLYSVETTDDGVLISILK